MTYQGGFRPKPPSYWHSQARETIRKYPQHETIKQELLNFLRTRPITGLRPNAFVDHDVEGEYALIKNGEIYGYIDAIEIVTVNFVKSVNLFEVKPVIDTVSGVIRQTKSYLRLAQECIRAEMHFAHIVVPASDPKINQLRAEWPHTWAWGVKFEGDEP